MLPVLVEPKPNPVAGAAAAAVVAAPKPGAVRATEEKHKVDRELNWHVITFEYKKTKSFEFVVL